MKGLFTIHLLITGMMCGIIWIIQILHYPLFAHVGETAFAQYEVLHRNWISPLVGPLMVAELATGFILLSWRPEGISPYFLWIGMALIGIIWLNTFFQAVPLHNKLLDGLSPEAVKSLVRVNWIRTVAWTVRLGILGWIAYRLMKA
ncbi:MAG: hypothetical protein AAF927_07875 [Bacteroidota bacterium]